MLESDFKKSVEMVLGSTASASPIVADSHSNEDQSMTTQSKPHSKTKTQSSNFVEPTQAVHNRRLFKCFRRCVRAHRGQFVCSLADLRARFREKGLSDHHCIEQLLDKRVLNPPPNANENLPLTAPENLAVDTAAFTVPFFLKFLSDMSTARKELLKLISKRHYREVLWDDCIKWNLKAIELPTELVVRDLVGSGLLDIAAQTTAGRILRYPAS